VAEQTFWGRTSPEHRPQHPGQHAPLLPYRYTPGVYYNLEMVVGGNSQQTIELERDEFQDAKEFIAKRRGFVVQSMNERFDGLKTVPSKDEPDATVGRKVAPKWLADTPVLEYELVVSTPNLPVRDGDPERIEMTHGEYVTLKCLLGCLRLKSEYDLDGTIGTPHETTQALEGFWSFVNHHAESVIEHSGHLLAGEED
jgi:hypothetical protein